jgi:PTH1 family peptidyl-tRNA hydrolase
MQALAKQENFAFHPEKSFQGELGQFTLKEIPYMVFIPLTYMNKSGIATRLIAQFYKILPHEILVAHDDLDLPIGTIRLKTAGGHGGHNGLKDIIAHLGSNAFHRLRIGIGHPGHSSLVHNYVLGKPSLSDKQQMQTAIDRGLTLLPLALSGDLTGAMNQLNR